jgi:rhodanese-related sulfurtransferase
MSELIVITPDDIYNRVRAGKALLVCAYDEEEKFVKFRLEGAISLKELESQLPKLPKDREIVFYCA